MTRPSPFPHPTRKGVPPIKQHPRDNKKPTSTPIANGTTPSAANPAPTPAEVQPDGTWARILARPVSGLSLAAFRIAVGVVMLLEAISFFLPSQSSGGRSHLDVYYAGKDIAFNLPYPGFGWLPLLPSPWVEGVGVLLGLGAIGMVFGFRYRVSALLTFLAWGYLYAVESTRTYWMSYYYLELIVLFVMVWMPAAARWSVDASRWGDRTPPEIPFWPVYLLRAQLVVTYFYAGFAKLNHDWLLEGVPVRIFLEKPWVASRLKALLPAAWASGVDAAVHSPVLIHFLGWTGAVFDLAIGALLLVRRTRTLGCGLLLIFHGTNHGILFNDIVWFPLLGVATATIFLDPDWPARLGRWLTAPRLPRPDWRWALPGAVLLPGVGALLGWRSAPTPATPGSRTWTALGRATPTLVAAWIALQAVFPLRNLLIPGDSRYTFEGLSWSWRLKAEVYRTDPCVVSVSDPTLAKPASEGPSRLDWAAWRSDRILFREVDPLRLDWSQQPELVVLFDPLMGDRVVYNAQSSNVVDRSESAARRRVAELWNQLHGRAPEAVNRTAPLSRILEGYDKAMRLQGMRFNNANEILGTLDRLNGRHGDGRMLPVLRKADPFPLNPKAAQGLVFLQIEDKALFSNPPVPVPRLLAGAWKNGPAGVTAWPADATQATPAVVLCEPLGLDASDLLPSFYAAVPRDRAELEPEIRWNLIRDAGISKSMHIGIQPFLMRRYARRVADAWRKDYGHDPAVHVAANISINGHAPRELVDPKADLLTVPLTWFGHNGWIRNGDRSEFGSTGGPP